MEHRRLSSVDLEVSKHINGDQPDHSTSLDNAKILEVEPKWFKRGAWRLSRNRSTTQRSTKTQTLFNFWSIYYQWLLPKLFTVLVLLPSSQTKVNMHIRFSIQTRLSHYPTHFLGIKSTKRKKLIVLLPDYHNPAAPHVTALLFALVMLLYQNLSLCHGWNTTGS